MVTPTGGRVAYATVGRGPALVVPAAWIGHLEVGWQDPAVRAFYAPIAACRTVVAYDKPGCGLSDPWPAPQTLDTDLEVLEAVTDHLQLDRVDLLGLSMAAPASLAGRSPFPHVGDAAAVVREILGFLDAPARGCPPNRPTGQPAGSRPASFRLPPWSPPA